MPKRVPLLPSLERALRRSGAEQITVDDAENAMRIEDLSSTSKTTTVRRHRKRKARPETLLVSRREAAAMLGCGRNNALEKLITQGDLHLVPAGRSKKLLRKEVEALAEHGWSVDETRPRAGRRRFRLP